MSKKTIRDIKKLELALEKMEMSLGVVDSDIADRLVAAAGTLIKEYIEENKQTKKIPYTAETFPENAIWIRPKGSNCRFVISIVDGDMFFVKNHISVMNVRFDDVDGWEIGFLTKHHKVEWKPFYQEVNN